MGNRKLSKLRLIDKPANGLNLGDRAKLKIENKDAVLLRLAIGGVK